MSGDPAAPPSKEDRKHVRFKVAGFTDLVAVLDPQFEAILVNIGIGGAGFYSAVPYPRLKMGNRVFSKFDLKGVTAEFIEIQGRIAHVTPVELNGKTVTFYGVEFLSAHHGRISPILVGLQGLVAEGKVTAY